MVSPLNSFVGLTCAAPGVARTLLASLYPTGRRNFLRVYPTDDLQGAALALLARDRGRRSVYVLDDGEPAMGRCWRRGSRRRPIDSVCGSRAARPGIPRTAPTRRWHGASPRRRAGRLRRRPARHERRPRGARPARKARERCRPARARRAHTTAAARALRRTLGTRSVREPRRRRLREASASWRRVRTPLRRTQTGDTIEPAAVYAAQAAEVVQDSIARSDGTRGSVLDELFRTRVRGGLLGDFSFDRRGDITESPVTILQVANGGPSRRVASVVARVWRPRAELVNQRPLGGWGSRWDGLVHGGGGRRGSRPSSTRPRTSPSCQR